MDRVKNHFEDEAEVFDELILKIIPRYQEMIQALILSLPFHQKERISVLDLGCGTGNVSLVLKEKFKKAHIICVDLAENMINTSKFKLSEYKDIIFIQSDIRELEFNNDFDAVISSLALHHLKPPDLAQYYHRIHDYLQIGGVFYNADLFLGSTAHQRQIYREKWVDHMLKSFSWEEIEKILIPKHQAEDYPLPLSEHLKWLKDAGFKEIDVIWKYYMFGVYGGKKK